MSDFASIGLRRTRAVHVAERAGALCVYPEPHRSPVLPEGWGPLGAVEQAAVLQACDARPHACRLRLGSVWDEASEYRVYCLEGDWGGACAATVFTVDAHAAVAGAGRNGRLIGVGSNVHAAVRLALDFANWDLEADGAPWRLCVEPAPGV